jgi:hypothetical protein
VLLKHGKVSAENGNEFLAENGKIFFAFLPKKKMKTRKNENTEILGGKKFFWRKS